MKHITSEKGDIGELMVSADLIEKGYPVFTPISSTSPFDLLVLIEGNYKRVQVKYRKINAQGTVNISQTRHSISQNKIVEKYNEFIDIIAIYCPNTNKCYYINSKDFESHLSLRFTPSKNNQSQGVRMAKDYLTLK